jgi:hypothetical protein
MRYYISPFFLSIVFLFILTSCQEDAIPIDDSNFSSEIGIDQSASISATQVDMENVYRQTAIGYHHAVADILANSEELISHPEWYTTGEDSPSSADIVARLRVLSLQDAVKVEEADKMASFFQFWEELDIANLTYIEEVDQGFNDWRAREGISLRTAPITYHVSKVIQMIYTNAQATLGREDSEIPINFDLQKNNDGLLCRVAHRNWLSAQFGLCTGANDNAIAEELSDAVRDRIASEASDRFNSFSRAVAINLLGGVEGNLNFIETQGLNILNEAVENVLENIIDEGWNATWCKQICDNCGPALGIARVRSGCTFVGIRALGSEFEFNEGLEFLLDYNEDGVADDTRLTFTEDLPASAINNNGPFLARVNVTCDGDREFSWPGNDNNIWIRIDPEQTPGPTGSISAPPRDNGLFYRPGTQYCFSANITTSTGWIFNGWETSGGASPSTQTGGTSFCTTFNNSSPINGTVNLVFTDQCNGQVRRIAGPFFVICPVSSCP